MYRLFNRYSVRSPVTVYNTLTSPINLYMTISGELKIKQSQKINNNKKKTENPFLYCL